MRSFALAFSLGVLAACGGDAALEEIASSRAAESDSARALSASCSGCHSPGGSAISDLSGWTREALVARMKFYQQDADGTTVMHRLARGYSNDEIDLIASYLSDEEGEGS